MGKAREYTWYIHSGDMHTNAVIAQGFDPDESCAFGIRCEDGVERNLWRADHALLSYLKESKKKQEVLDFEVFVKVEDGRSKCWDGFPREKLARELQALAARAKAIKERVQAA